jgi:beta-mannosidase
MGFALWMLLASSLAVAQVFDLSELQWTLKNQNGSIVVPGSLPSQAHLDLFEAGIINDPLLGINGALCNIPINYSTLYLS